jgi:DNA-binding NarL/FixJ family response regulator
MKAFGSVAPPYWLEEPEAESVGPVGSNIPVMGGAGVGRLPRDSRASHDRASRRLFAAGPANADSSSGRTHGLDLDPDAHVLIVDDCMLHRDNLAAAIAAAGADVSVAWDLPSLVSGVRDAALSFVLLNVATSDSSMLLAAALKMNPSARVIVLGVSEDDESAIVACAEAGVAGYHTRSESFEDLLALMGKVADGESQCSPRVSAVLLRRLSALASQRQPAVKELVLTTREAQVLDMIRMGMSNRDIAAELCIAVHTVKNHVHSVLNKLGVRTRAEAAALPHTSR